MNFVKVKNELCEYIFMSFDNQQEIHFQYFKNPLQIYILNHLICNFIKTIFSFV